MMPVRPPLLVVDDDDGILGLLSEALSEGYEVATAHNGWEALETLQTRPFFLLLVDINLPLMGGVELIQKIRSHPDFDGLVIVVCSAAEGLRALVAGLDVQGLLPKPFNLTQLKDKVSLALELRENVEWSERLARAVQAAAERTRVSREETERIVREARKTRKAM